MIQPLARRPLAAIDCGKGDSTAVPATTGSLRDASSIKCWKARAWSSCATALNAPLSMTSRARRVSKATLYPISPTNACFFWKSPSTECRSQADDADPHRPQTPPWPRCCGWLPENHRLSCCQISASASSASRWRNPRISPPWRISSTIRPKAGADRLAEILRCATERGELVIDDIPFAAAQFARLCKVDIQDRMIFGPARAAPPPTPPA